MTVRYLGESEQGRLWGQSDLALPKSKGQQLELFSGQGPGGALPLPDGVPVGQQGTLDLAGSLAEQWPDPEVPEV